MPPHLRLQLGTRKGFQTVKRNNKDVPGRLPSEALPLSSVSMIFFCAL